MTPEAFHENVANANATDNQVSTQTDLAIIRLTLWVVGPTAGPACPIWRSEATGEGDGAHGRRS